MSTMIRFAVFVLILSFASLSFGQATRTWVSGVGDDANPCSRTAPCKTFAGAISKTAAGGTINVLDPGAYGAVTVTKSITIEADGDFAGILASGTNGVVINAGAGDNVVLRNIKIDGIGTGLSGVRLLNAGTLMIDSCTITDFADFAVDIATTSATKVTIRNSVLRRAGNSLTEALVRAQPTAPGTIFLNIQGSTMVANKSGLRVSGAVKFGIRDTTLTGGDSQGIIVTNTADITAGWLNNVQISDFPAGITVSGANSSVRVTDSMITNNGTGLVSSSSGQIITLGDNRVVGNSINGAFTGVESKQ